MKELIYILSFLLSYKTFEALLTGVDIFIGNLKVVVAIIVIFCMKIRFYWLYDDYS